MEKGENMTQINNNINFTARMDVSKVLEKQRWKNVSKKFSHITKDYPKDKVYIVEYNEGINAEIINSKNGDEIEARFSLEDIENLMKMSDEKIAEQFKKILDINKVKNAVYQATTKYVTAIEKALSKDEIDSIPIWDNATNIAQQEAQNLQKQDSFLQNLDILW